MKFNDNITLDIASAVSDVLEGKTKKEEVKYPHKMYHPETGEEVEVMDKAGHDKYNAKGYVHEKPKNESPEEPRAKGEKDFKDKHVVKKSGEKEDGTVVKEKKEVKEDDVDDSIAKISKEESDKQKKYQAFFAKALKKFGVKSPAELEGDKKKEFFDYVDANYEADDEPEEGVKEEVDKLAVKKYADMKAKIGTLQNNIAKTKDSKFRMKSGGQEKIDGWNKDIEKIRDIMKKMVDKFGSGVSKGGPGFTGGA
tara:strand:+ start:9626 stop:10384 length:759 start_codon:yes stop_codon:yes gene_type:complete